MQGRRKAWVLHFLRQAVLDRGRRGLETSCGCRRVFICRKMPCPAGWTQGMHKSPFVPPRLVKDTERNYLLSRRLHARPSPGCYFYTAGPLPRPPPWTRWTSRGRGSSHRVDSAGVGAAATNRESQLLGEAPVLAGTPTQWRLSAAWQESWGLLIWGQGNQGGALSPEEDWHSADRRLGPSRP